MRGVKDGEKKKKGRKRERKQENIEQIRNERWEGEKRIWKEIRNNKFDMEGRKEKRIWEEKKWYHVVLFLSKRF